MCSSEMLAPPPSVICTSVPEPININIIPCLTNCSPMSFCSDLLVRTKLMTKVTKQKYAHFYFHFLAPEVTIIIHKVTNSIKSHSLEYFLSSLLQLLHTLSKREKECTILNFLANLRESYQACFLEKAERG